MTIEADSSLRRLLDEVEARPPGPADPAARRAFAFSDSRAGKRRRLLARARALRERSDGGGAARGGYAARSRESAEPTRRLSVDAQAFGSPGARRGRSHRRGAGRNSSRISQSGARERRPVPAARPTPSFESDHRGRPRSGRAGLPATARRPPARPAPRLRGGARRRNEGQGRRRGGEKRRRIRALEALRRLGGDSRRTHPSTTPASRSSGRCADARSPVFSDFAGRSGRSRHFATGGPSRGGRALEPRALEGARLRGLDSSRALRGLPRGDERRRHRGTAARRHPGRRLRRSFRLGPNPGFSRDAPSAIPSSCCAGRGPRRGYSLSRSPGRTEALSSPIPTPVSSTATPGISKLSGTGARPRLSAARTPSSSEPRPRSRTSSTSSARSPRPSRS